MASSTTHEYSSRRYYSGEGWDRPAGSRLFDHHLGRIFDEDPFFQRSTFGSSGRSNSATNVSSEKNDYTSKNEYTSSSSSSTTGAHAKTEERSFFDDKDKIVIMLDVASFTPNEINVKVTENNMLLVEAEHVEKKDIHGFVERKLKRRYVLPQDVDVQAIVSDLSKDGLLTIKAPKRGNQKFKERVIPVQVGVDARRKFFEKS